MPNHNRLLSRRTAVTLLGGAMAAPAVLRSSPARAASTIRMGTLKTPHWSATWLIPNYIGNSTKVELVEFKNSLEMISAMAAGNVDVVTIGYWHFVRMLDQGVNAKAFAGLCSGGTRLVVRKGVTVNDWADLKGKTCAVARGSTQDIQFLLALKNRGLSQKDINYRDLGGNMAVLITALQQGQVDVASMWEPFASQVIQQDIAKQFSTLYDESFSVNGLVVAPAEFIAKNGEAIQALVGAHVKATDQLAVNANEFLDMAVKLSGFPRETMVMANANSVLEYVLRFEDARKLAAAVLEFGYVRTDVRDKLDTAIDYQFIMKATGRSRKELGG